MNAALQWRFMGSLNLQRLDAHWDHEPPWWSAGFRPGEFGDITMDRAGSEIGAPVHGELRVPFGPAHGP
ncbi:MAG TPA: hypothetical protein VFA77_02040 [Candidatus Eisenbacteria bacterium]|nr:hypothetical protein [Candidatus Eisenbacteria bacterium]